MKSKEEHEGEQSEPRSLYEALMNPPVEEIVLSLIGWKSQSDNKPGELFFGFSEEPVCLPDGKESLYIQAIVRKMAKRRKGASYGDALIVCVGYPREFMESIAVWLHLNNRDLDEKYFPNPDLSPAEREVLLRVAGERQIVKAIVKISKYYGLWSGFDTYGPQKTLKQAFHAPPSPFCDLVLIRHAEKEIEKLLSTRPD